MSEVRRWAHTVKWEGLQISAAYMAINHGGEYVMHADYVALAAELEQAREEIEGMHKSLDKLRGQCAGFSAYAEIDRLTAELAAIKGQEVAGGN